MYSPPTSLTYLDKFEHRISTCITDAPYSHEEALHYRELFTGRRYGYPG